MIKFINDALKHRNGEKGFSLVELIVVVAILGILVVIAIPVFGAIQTTARQNTVSTAASNGATSVAAAVTANNTSTAALNAAKTKAITDLNTQGGNDLRYSLAPASGTTMPADFTPAGTIPATAPATGTVPATWASVGKTAPTGTSQVIVAENTTSDNVFVYAVNNRGEWAGAGTKAASVNNFG